MTSEPTHDVFGNRLPVKFEMVEGMFAPKRHDPTGDEVRVTLFVEGCKPSRHTFTNLDVARPFMNASNAGWQRAEGRRVVVEFGDDTKMTLRLGKTY